MHFPQTWATFHVFDQNRSSNFHHAYQFTPSQGLSKALSPVRARKGSLDCKQMWTSGAILFPDSKRPIRRLGSVVSSITSAKCAISQRQFPLSKEFEVKRRTARRVVVPEPSEWRRIGLGPPALRIRSGFRKVRRPTINRSAAMQPVPSSQRQVLQTRRSGQAEQSPPGSSH